MPTANEQAQNLTHVFGPVGRGNCQENNALAPTKTGNDESLNYYKFDVLTVVTDTEYY
jgi:hypothetical protein